MRHGADHGVGRAPRQLGIRIQRDDVLCVGKRAQVSGLDREGIELTLEQLVQIEQLAPFPLPAHPHSLARIENAMPVQQEERSRSRFRVALVQFVGQLNRQLDQRISIVLPRPRHRVRQIGKQAKVDVGVLVRQVADLEIVEEFPYLLLLHQQRRHHHQGGEGRRHSFGKVELRQGIGFENRGDRVVHQVDRTLRDRQQ